ncbi:GAG-POL-RELATED RETROTRANSPOSON [Plasmopara halstedii]|uniref:GAG-POL-RELATED RETROTRANSPOSON n=1 Tax=Plasmopara halstedii TaxID=4781 RepID=A0A0P1ANR9_PLAHL|nr:GAG-POL-RELATED RETROTRANSPOSON [Plasmopara halstedii]CEG42894.1 GAG-POL-RELATED RETROTRANSPOSON [Plasmopara halstedii]|eukprot:XP_024579263.1 GAG-POL-RELATED RETROTRANSPOSON [Plasmopara halstedii]
MMYHRAIDGFPVQRVLSVKADLHHLRPFGSLVYIQVPSTPESSKRDDNANIGYLLGLEMDTVGARVYIPNENTVKFVAEVRVIAETIVGATVAYEASMADEDRSADVNEEDEGEDHDS